MSGSPDSANDETGSDADEQSASMQAQLSKEAASWAKKRRDHSGETGAGLKQPRPDRRPRQAAADAKPPTASPAAAKPADTRSRPFSMSYDGQTQAEYAQYLLDRGSR